MIIVFFRAIILYIFVLLSMRIMGKREIAQMQPFELVITLMIAELAALPMEDLGSPLIKGLIAISTLIVLQLLISYINLKCEKARGLISGKPSILVNKGKINEQELRNLRININDLMEQLRSNDYANLNDVEFAILETNGALSIIPRPEKKPLTPEDLDIEGTHEGLPLSLIIDGHINKNNLKKFNKDEQWLYEHLKEHNVKNIKDILFCYMDANEEVYIHKKEATQNDEI